MSDIEWSLSSGVGFSVSAGFCRNRRRPGPSASSLQRACLTRLHCPISSASHPACPFCSLKSRPRNDESVCVGRSEHWFAGFSPRLPISGVRRPIRNARHPAKCRFSSEIDHNPRSSNGVAWERSDDRSCLPAEFPANRNFSWNSRIASKVARRAPGHRNMQK